MFSMWQTHEHKHKLICGCSCFLLSRDVNKYEYIIHMWYFYFFFPPQYATNVTLLLVKVVVPQANQIIRTSHQMHTENTQNKTVDLPNVRIWSKHWYVKSLKLNKLFCSGGWKYCLVLFCKKKKNKSVPQRLCNLSLCCPSVQCPKLAIGRHLEDTTKSHLTMMCNLVGRQRQEILELRREMEELSVSHDGILIWKLNDYSRKLQEAKLRSNHEFFSPPFYTHRYGYKLQVSAFLNGNGSGEGSHLSVYIRVLPGEYDNLLEWPFSYKVTFSILDQSDPSLSKPQHITETFNPDPNWKNFQKPCSSRNSLDESTLGFGYPKFISHEEIKKRNYIRDNCIFIKASIEIPQKIMA